VDRDGRAGGPGAAAGLQVGDRVLGVDGADVATVGANVVMEQLHSVRVGQVVHVRLERGGAAMEVTLTANGNGAVRRPSGVGARDRRTGRRLWDRSGQCATFAEPRA